MAVTETTTQSWVSRLGGAFKGVLVGLGLFIFGFPVLFWNEGNTVKARKALEEGEGACVAVESNARIDAEMDGQLVHMSGLADTKDVLSDDLFGVSVTGIKLIRTVEMYQWEEEASTTEKKKMGGSVEKVTTYTYKKDWCGKAIDSASFKEAGHDNPGAMEFQSDKLTAQNVTFGAFVLSESQIDRIGKMETLAFGNAFTCKVDRVQVVGNTIYVPNAETRNNEKNNRQVQSEPRIGDMRVTYQQILPHDISLVAKQKGNSFVAYVAKNGRKVSLLADGIKDSAEMFSDAQSANTTICWIIRFVGFFMMYIGLCMAFKPLSVLADVLPLLGDIVGMGTGFIAGALALVCSLVTIAVAWIFYRPVLAVVLLAVAGFVAWKVWQKKQARKAAAVPSAS